MMRFFRIYGLSCVTTLAILYVCIARSIPSVPMPKFPYEDKLIHFLMYLVLSCVFCYELFRQRFTFLDKKMWGWGMLFPILYGGLIEILQENFFPPRTGEWMDWLSDILGVLIGFFVCKYIFPKKLKPENQGISCR